MALLRTFIRSDLDELVAENVRLRVIGDYRRFGTDLTEMIDGAIARTAANTGATLVIALNYGAQAEIAAAARRLAVRTAAGDICADANDERSDEHTSEPQSLMRVSESVYRWDEQKK